MKSASRYISTSHIVRLTSLWFFHEPWSYTKQNFVYCWNKLYAIIRYQLCWGLVALQADTNTASVQNFVYVAWIVSFQTVRSDHYCDYYYYYYCCSSYFLILFIIIIIILVVTVIIVIGVQVFTEAEVRASLVFQVSKLCSFMLKVARIATGGAAWDALVAGLPLHPLLASHTSWGVWLGVGA